MRIAQIRRSRGISRQRVAELTGIPYASITCLEGGYYRLNLDNLFKILSVIGANVQEVWPEIKHKGNLADDSFLKEVAREAWAQFQDNDVTYEDVIESVAEAARVGSDILRRKGRRRPHVLNRARCACGFLAQEQSNLTVAGLCRELVHNFSSMAHMMRRRRLLMERDPHNDFAQLLEVARENLEQRLSRKRP